jgi:hypothetical protein
LNIIPSHNRKSDCKITIRFISAEPGNRGATMRQRLIFMVGGPDFHPVNAQAEQIIDWLGPAYACHMADSLAAFEHLSECDLLVLMGQHWTGFEGRYRSPSEVHRRNFEKYVQSG